MHQPENDWSFQRGQHSSFLCERKKGKQNYIFFRVIPSLRFFLEQVLKIIFEYNLILYNFEFQYTDHNYIEIYLLNLFKWKQRYIFCILIIGVNWKKRSPIFVHFSKINLSCFFIFLHLQIEKNCKLSFGNHNFYFC